MRQYAWLPYPLCIALSAGIVAVFSKLIHVNQTTVALSMLLLVLGAATTWGLREAVFTSILCMLEFNFFFLPPIGTLTIADPQNWVALGAFLVTAVTASQLSALAKKRTQEATARRAEVERLYRLSQAMLLDENADLCQSALGPIRDIFKLNRIAFCDAQSGEVQPATIDALSRSRLLEVATQNEDVRTHDCIFTPVRLGARTVGSLMLEGGELETRELESLTNLVAIGSERIWAVRRAAEAEAQRRGEQLKAAVLDGIAHNLKTPLTAIKTCVTTLLTIPPQSEEKRSELLTIIDEETDRLHGAITEAIQLARVEAARVSLQRTPASLLDIVDNLAFTPEHRARLQIQIPAETRVSGDAELLSQAILQVIENALKYSTAEVMIAATEEENRVMLTVSDRGSGIGNTELSRIFEKFYRGARVRNSSKGSGIGLAVAKGIVEAHGGKIWAENRPGGGAMFSLRLPRA